MFARTALLVATLLCVSICAFAAHVPTSISIQGRLGNAAGDPLDSADITLECRVFDAATGGSEVWPAPGGESPETHPLTTDAGGLWQISLGSIAPLTEEVFAGTERWLEIRVLDGINPAVTLPRRQLISAPFAFRAGHADTADVALSAVSAESHWEAVGPQLRSLQFLGIARGGAGNQLRGDSVHTQINLGVACTTGTTGQPWAYSTVGGGQGNIASHWHSTVGGGQENRAAQSYTVVAGGQHNMADDMYGAVGGGFRNVATGLYATVAGGYGDTASGEKSAVIGGSYNIAGGENSFVAGRNNRAIGAFSAITGGLDNRTNFDYSAIAGGQNNEVNADGGFIGGGVSNILGGGSSFIGGGSINRANGLWSTVAGGSWNVAGTHYAVVGGGDHDSANGQYSGVFSGYMNRAGDSPLDTAAVVGGGWFNAADAKRSLVGGGAYNRAYGDVATISGGYANEAGGLESTIGGGRQNVTEGIRATIAGGFNNWAEGQTAFVGGGYNNHARRTNSAVGGGNSNNAGSTTAGNHSFIGGGYSNQTEGEASAIGGGYDNYAGGDYSAISGGYSDTITAAGDYSYLFGIGSKLTQDSTFMVDMPHIRFGKETGGYEIPSVDGANGQVLVTNGAGKVSWGAASGVAVPLYLSGSYSGPVLMVSQAGVGAAMDVHNTNGSQTTAYIATTNEGIVGFRSMNAGRLGRTECGVRGEYDFPVQRYGMLGTATYGAFGKDSASGNWGALGTPAYGVYGASSAGWAGYFSGKSQARLDANGLLSYPLVVGNQGASAGTATALLFQVDGGDVRGKGAIAYERTGIWNRGDIHFLQDAGENESLADLNDAVMTIKNSGNVGIGTKTPGEKLEVKGNIRLDAGAGAGSMLRIFEAGVNKWALNYRPWASGKLAFTNDIGGGVALLTLDPVNNRVGIYQDSPAYRLDVNGDCHATSFPTSSDARLKTNIAPLTNVLERVQQIRGIAFDWNEVYDSLGRSNGRREIGVIAQEVEAQFPELVTHWGDEEYHAVDYGRLTAVLLEAIKEQQKQIEELRARVDALLPK